MLAKDPTNAAAQTILAQVDQGKALASRPAALRRNVPRPTTEPTSNRATVIPEERPTTPAPTVTAIATDARLALSFSSQVPQGVVMIYRGSQRLLREEFRFREGSGLRARGTAGGFERSLTIPAGDADLRVYVTPTGRPAVVKTISGNFPGGSARHLTIDVAQGGGVSLRLE